MLSDDRRGLEEEALTARTNIRNISKPNLKTHEVCLSTMSALLGVSLITQLPQSHHVARASLLLPSTPPGVRLQHLTP